MKNKNEIQCRVSYEYFVWTLGKEILESSKFLREKGFLQHGRTTTYEHSVMVALVAMKIARVLRLKIDYESLVRGCLLHDYYLYDWHEPDSSHRLHGLRHGRRAVENATKDFGLNQIEYNMILSHMFPLSVLITRTPSWSRSRSLKRSCGQI